MRLVLDSQFDDPTDARSNAATARYVDSVAGAEDLNLEARLGNPTGSGIHNKMVLAQIGGAGFVHVGSINGSENSNKNNREVPIQIESTDAYFYLEEMFRSDWDTSSAATPEPAPAPTVTNVSVAGSTSLERDATVQMTATATQSDGTTMNVTDRATWSSDNVSVATVTSTGRVTGQSPGAATIIALYEGVGGSLLVTVTDPTPLPAFASGAGVVINEFRARGLNGARDEFVELRNDSADSVNIGGWELWGSNASGTTSNRRNIPSSVVLGPGCHYPLGNSHSSGYKGPTDATFGTGFTGNGGLAIRKPDGTIVDQVGMSSGSAYK